MEGDAPRRYPAEFRRKVLDLAPAGRPVEQVAYSWQISAQTIYVWRRQLITATRRARRRRTSLRDHQPNS
jgi:transposase